MKVTGKAYFDTQKNTGCDRCENNTSSKFWKWKIGAMIQQNI